MKGKIVLIKQALLNKEIDKIVIRLRGAPPKPANAVFKCTKSESSI